MCSSKPSPQELESAIAFAMSALLNVPMVGEPYDQQHSNTHQRAYLRLHSLREAMTIPRAAVAARSIARSRPASLPDPAIMAPGWTSVHDDMAIREGWALFECSGSVHGRWQIQRLDDAAELRPGTPRLTSDEDAMLLVARGTGAHHRAAMEFLKVHNPMEHQAILSLAAKYVPARIAPNFIASEVQPITFTEDQRPHFKAGGSWCYLVDEDSGWMAGQWLRVTTDPMDSAKRNAWWVAAAFSESSATPAERDMAISNSLAEGAACMVASYQGATPAVIAGRAQAARVQAADTRHTNAQRAYWLALAKGCEGLLTKSGQSA